MADGCVADADGCAVGVGGRRVGREVRVAVGIGVCVGVGAAVGGGVDIGSPVGAGAGVGLGVSGGDGGGCAVGGMSVAVAMKGWVADAVTVAVTVLLADGGAGHVPLGAVLGVIPGVRLGDGTGSPSSVTTRRPCMPIARWMPCEQ